jgi:DNA invertase Pin-like site-specific DNA recombinase
MPIAYSYMRFSSEKQAKGDSFRRQEDLVKDYLERHPEIELDTSLNLKDSGLSAYKGVHTKKGALGVFIRLVDDGKIEKGSYLLVEHFDRLSREEVLTAQSQFLQLINDDIIVVTLADGREYSKQSVNANPMELFFSIMLMVKAHDESAEKGRRVKDAWTQKMKRVADGVQLTKRVPFWINKEDRTKSIADKVAIVRRIFKLSADGLGGQRITAILNEDGVAPPTAKATKWGISSVKKVLNSESVIGVREVVD